MDKNSSATHRSVQKSTTLNRKYVKAPSAPSEAELIDSVAKRRAEDLKRRQALADKINRERLAAMRSNAGVRANAPVAPVPPVAPAAVPAPSPSPKPLSATIEKSLVASGKPTKEERSAKEIKDSAIKNALKSVSSLDTEEASTPAPTISAKKNFGAKKLALALGCAALAVGVVAYFVSTNTPDLSVRVAAMQSGIDASYPAYVPRGYSLSDIVSEENKLSMTFSASDGNSFELVEEKSAWDNETLEENYVKSTWGNNYTSVREQGITIYISASDATWVNGGLLYKLNASGNNLTKKQIKSIVVSL